MAVTLATLNACSNTAEREPPQAYGTVGNLAGNCGPNCSQAFILGSHKPLSRPVKTDCNPDCP